MDTKKILVIIAALFMVMSVGAILSLNQSSGSHSGTPSASPSVTGSSALGQQPAKTTSSVAAGLSSAPSLSQRMQMYNQVVQYSKDHGIPLSNVYIPNYLSHSKILGGHVTPGYAISPAPMGIGDYGLMNKSGQIVTYNYTTQSFEAALSINQLNNFYLAANDAHSVTFQLNAVLNNVGLFGTPSQMWTQNVIVYSSRTHQLTFEDNVWNFSSPATYLTTNAINYSSAVQNGKGATGGGFHYGYSQSFNMSYPFTVDLYLNTSVTATGNSVVWYNYTIVSGYINATTGASKGKISGNYDEVIFNSTYGQPASYSAPHPHYLVSGTQLTPTGFIPYDAEIMIGGPGGGSTAVINGINGTMNLMNYNGTASKYQNVRAAYDIGSETGETSVGVDVHNAGATAYLSSGPGLVYGLWNNTYSWSKKTVTTSTTSGSSTYMFLNNNLTMINQGIYAWAPLTKATSTFYLPSSTYLYDALQNYHIPIMEQVLGSSTDLTTMTKMNSVGIYTPIMITNNSQLKAMANSGAGTVKNPYIINASSSTGMNPLFGALNDYEFPTFPGLLIMNTSDYVVVNDMAMPVTYTGFNALLINFYNNVVGLNQPLANEMQLQIYNSSNVSVTNSSNVNVWFSGEFYPYFYDGAFEIWNSTNIQIYNNSFVSWGSAITVYNPSAIKANITIFNNEFMGLSVANTLTPAQTAGLGYSFDFGSQQVGIQLFSSYDHVYRNAFVTQTPVMSVDFNIYCGDVPVVAYGNDSFNTTSAIATSMNGWNLTGPLGTFMMNSTDLGNYWWNYNGAGSYNDSGMITTGTDYEPIVFPNAANITFSASGAQGQFMVSFGGLLQNGAAGSPATYMDIPAGTYYYSYEYVNAFSEASCTLGVAVLSPGSTTTVLAASTYVHLSFTETGLASGVTWTVNVNGMTMTGNTTTQSMGVTPGVYTYQVVGISGYTTVDETNTINVASNTAVNIAFTSTTYTLNFTESGLSNGTLWTVTIGGTTYKTHNASQNVNLPAGTYSFSTGNVSGYTSSSVSGKIIVNGNAQFVIKYTPIPSTPAPSNTFAYELLGAGLVGGLVVGAGLSMVFFRKKP
ncbi:MAG: thermopsin [Thermoplasmataceae archaeon]